MISVYQRQMMEQAEQTIDELWETHDAIKFELVDSPDVCGRYEHEHSEYTGRKMSSVSPTPPPSPFLIRSDDPALEPIHFD